jgi:hypothetical protein
MLNIFLYTNNNDRQLAVANGLVADRVQMITQGIVAVQERPSRMSYGVVCDQVYKKKEHVGEYVIKDPRDGKLWAKAQIEWIIKEVSILFSTLDNFKELNISRATKFP